MTAVTTMSKRMITMATIKMTLTTILARFAMMRTTTTMMADAVARGQPQLLASQLDGRFAIFLRALWPSALFKIMEGKARKLD